MESEEISDWNFFEMNFQILEVKIFRFLFDDIYYAKPFFGLGLVIYLAMTGATYCRFFVHYSPIACLYAEAKFKVPDWGIKLTSV